MKSLLQFFVACTATLVLASCGGSSGSGTTPNGEPTLPPALFESFAFLAENNIPFLATDIEGIVDGNTIHMSVPQGVNVSRLKPAFVINHGDVYVGDDLQLSAESAQDFNKPIVYELRAADVDPTLYEVVISYTDIIVPGVPKLQIFTRDGAAINSTTVYTRADLSIDGGGLYEDFSNLDIDIRGRGNSTWNYPKKPYKIKLKKSSGAQPLMGLPPARQWILLAQFIDHTLLTDAIAMKAGRLLAAPYSHHMIPVEVEINGQYEGVYLFTEQKEVGENRIDIGEDGTYIELTTSKGREPAADPTDKLHWFFNTNSSFNLPVLVRYPKLADIYEDEGLETATARFNEIQNEVAALESCIEAEIYLETNCEDLIDPVSIAKFLIVQQITRNLELAHPKSVFLHKRQAERFVMGPLWDFDWAWGGSGTTEQFRYYASYPILNRSSSTNTGSIFFDRVLHSPAVKEQFQLIWADFRINHWDDLKNYTQEIGQVLIDSGAYERDHARWAATQDPRKPGEAPRSTNLAIYLDAIDNWLEERGQFIDSVAQAMSTGTDDFSF